MTQNYWQAEEARIVAEDPSATADPWTTMLDRYLMTTQPELREQLQRQNALQAYLTVKVQQARQFQDEMEEMLAGTPNAVMQAQTLALSEMMPVVGSDAATATADDFDDANGAMETAATAFLTSPQLSQRPSPK